MIQHHTVDGHEILHQKQNGWLKHVFQPSEILGNIQDLELPSVYIHLHLNFKGFFRFFPPKSAMGG